MKAYSPDLQQRVLSAALHGDRTIPEVAGLFGVSMTFTYLSALFNLAPLPLRLGGRRDARLLGYGM